VRFRCLFIVYIKCRAVLFVLVSFRVFQSFHLKVQFLPHFLALVFLVIAAKKCFYKKCVLCKNKKLHWCWQTRATRLEVSPCHQTWYDSISRIRYGFILVCYSNFVPLRYSTCNYTVTLKPESGVCQNSLKVIQTDSYRSATYDLLLTFHSNHGSIPYRFWD